MKKFVIASILALVSVSAQAMEQTSFTIGPITVQKDQQGSYSFFMGIPMTSAQGGHNDDYYKLVAAQDDAVNFVATNGAPSARTAVLSSALEMVRSKAPDLQASDIQIAQEMIGFSSQK
jgi:uncharacterized protein (TIGR02448 family)